jgi:hypothetical protein
VDGRPSGRLSAFSAHIVRDNANFLRYYYAGSEGRMNEMIDRLAKRLCTCDEQDGAAPWDYHDAKQQEGYRDRVRALVAAMREPTEAMVDEGRRSQGISEADDLVCWGAMIDEALRE